MVTRPLLERAASLPLETFAADPEAYDLVLTDMSMPQMTGDQFVKEIHAISPDMPVVVGTGFSERIQRKTAASMGVKAFLMKPVGLSELAVAVRNVLDNVTYESTQKTL